MSSVLSGYRGRSDLPIPNGAVVLTYDTDGPTLPVPWTYDNGTLDLDFSGDFNSGTSMNENDTAFLRYSPNALHLVNAIGPNLVAWMENQGGADSGSVRVHEYPIVIRANGIQVNSNPNSDSTTGTSTDPYNFTQSAGGPSNNWYATYLFQKALVLKYTTGGGATTEYRFFTTQIGERNT